MYIRTVNTVKLFSFFQKLLSYEMFCSVRFDGYDRKSSVQSSQKSSLKVLKVFMEVVEM